MYEARYKDNISSTSIQSYDNIEAFELNIVNENEIQVMKKDKFKLNAANKKN